ncbi:MAG TPA: hypothetical protein VM287_05190 [Egibacteraceae bacterium]|nr:hypothetical protein [Egibacteraceae bacterium]
MMKLRKNLLVGLLAGLLAFAGVACNGGGEEEPADTGTTEDPGLEEDPAPLDS